VGSQPLGNQDDAPLKSADSRLRKDFSWQVLAKAAAEEEDPDKLMQIIQALNDALNEKERNRLRWAWLTDPLAGPVLSAEPVSLALFGARFSMPFQHQSPLIIDRPSTKQKRLWSVMTFKKIERLNWLAQGRWNWQNALYGGMIFTSLVGLIYAFTRKWALAKNASDGFKREDNRCPEAFFAPTATFKPPRGYSV
jgi:hypothetical protein